MKTENPGKITKFGLIAMMLFFASCRTHFTQENVA
jgi:hypothetical protein